jgi:hypothetical protein
MGAGAVATTAGDGGYHHLLDPNRKWTNNKRLIALNGWIVLLLITSSTNGYDGSMMNGLQSLHQWNAAFNNPTGSMLGLLNAIQVRCFFFPHYTTQWLTASDRTLGRSRPTRSLRTSPMALAASAPSGLARLS